MKTTSTRGKNQEITEHTQFLIVLDTQVEMSSGKLTMSLHMRTKLPAPYLTLANTDAKLAYVAE